MQATENVLMPSWRSVQAGNQARTVCWMTFRAPDSGSWLSSMKYSWLGSGPSKCTKE